MGFEGFSFPHIRYVEAPGSTTTEMYYIGGETEENHTRLTVGGKYRVRQSLYAENPEDIRRKVWVCNDDENRGKLCRINRKNFSVYPLSERRDKKLTKILK